MQPPPDRDCVYRGLPPPLSIAYYITNAFMMLSLSILYGRTSVLLSREHFISLFRRMRSEVSGVFSVVLDIHHDVSPA